MSNPVPAPLQTPIVESPKTGLISRIWNQYFLALTTRLNKTAAMALTTTLANQTATIPLTALTLGSVSAGLYRVTTHLRITSPAGVSNSVQLSIGYTDGGVAQSQTGTAVTALSATALEGKTFVLHCDAASAISYSVAYASVPANTMVYRLDLAVEAVQ